MKRLLILTYLVFYTIASIAQSIKVEAPQIVASNELFMVEFKMDAEPSDFEAPSFEGFDVSAGPTVSQSTNIEYVNGKMSKSTLYSYIYVLVADKEGNKEIGAATATFDGKKVKSSSYPIEVVKERTNKNKNDVDKNNDNSANKSNASTIASDDFILKTEVNKTSVVKGEPIVAKLMLYTRGRVAGLNGVKLAAFDGFWKQQIENKEIPPVRETYNGKIYDKYTMAEFLLFPQKSGVLDVEQMSVDLVVAVTVDTPNSGNSIFDSFFGGGTTVQNVEKEIKSSPIKIKVEELPAGAPSSFNGAVGEFTMNVSLKDGKISANSATEMSISISGKGNFPMINPLKLSLPGSFEQYSSKTTDNYNVTLAGISGTKSFSYPIIVRAEGNYTLKPIEFTYFDLSTKNYRTLTSSDLTIDVLRDVTGNNNSGQGIVSGVTKEDLKILGEDIRFIRLVKPELHKKSSFLLWSSGYWLIVLIIIIVFVSLLLYMKHRIKELRDTVKIKNKKANRVATMRLKKAKRFMNEGKETEFYTEMMKALIGYVSDKLNIDGASFSKDRITELLLKRNVSEGDIEQLISTISDCEFSQYSGTSAVNMSGVYAASLDLLGRLENKL